MLRRAPDGFPRAVADAAALPFASAGFDVLVLAFMLFHLPDPAAGLREARRVLGQNGALAVATWGPDYAVPANEIWQEELDRHGAPQDAALVSRHDLLDTPDKVSALVAAAGFTDVRMAVVPWSYRPTADEFFAHHQSVGHTARRLARMPAAARDEFLRAVRARLARLDEDDFADRRQVIAGTAITATEPAGGSTVDRH